MLSALGRATAAAASCAGGERDDLPRPGSTAAHAGRGPQAQAPACSLPRGSAAAAAAAAALAAACAAALPPPAHAAPRPATLPDGTAALAYEFAVPLRVVALARSLPTSWLPAFRATQGPSARLHYSQRQQLAQLYALLQKAAAGGSGAPPSSQACPDAVTLGDAWLGPAVAAGLLAPVPGGEASRWLARLPAGWGRLLRRTPDGACCDGASGGASGGAGAAPSPLYGVPYRWGAVLLCVRTDGAGARATAGLSDWPHLLRPALRRRLALASSSPRDLVAIALRACGRSANTGEAAACARSAGDGGRAAADAAAAAGLPAALATLLRSVLVAGDGYLRSLAAGHAFAAVGPSDEVLPFVLRTPHTAALCPSSGALLFADCWVTPAARGAPGPGGHSPLLRAWLEFTSSPGRARPRLGLRGGGSPTALAPAFPHDAAGGGGLQGAAPRLPPAAAAAAAAARPLHDGGTLSAEQLSGSEFILPLGPAAERAYAQMLADAGDAARREAAADGADAAGRWWPPALPRALAAVCSAGGE